MEAEPMHSVTGVECNLLSLNFLNRDALKLSWVKSSAQQDTLVARHEDGSFFILKIKDKGHVSNFVLDPNLKSVFWDDENASEHCQWLFAQTFNGDVLLYAVDDDGVTRTLHISKSKLAGVVKHSQHVTTGDSEDKEILVVGCDRGNVILNINSACLCSIQVAVNGNIHLNCSLPLPQTSPALSKDSKEPIADQLSQYQIVNGSLVILDGDAGLMFMHSVSSGHCICQMDLHPLGVDINSVMGWRLAHDHSVLMLLMKDWTVIQVSLSDYSSQYPAAVKLYNPAGDEEAFNHEYLSYNLCRYGDNTWKREVVDQHMNVHHLSTKATSAKASSSKSQCVGFNSAKRRMQKGSTVSVLSPSVPFKSTLCLEASEREKGWMVDAIEASTNVLTMVLKRNSDSYGDSYHKAVCFANFSDQEMHIHHLSDSSTVVLSSSTTSSHLILSDKYLLFASPHVGVQKDDLITWMMSYSGPSTADNLCQTNEWTRTAVPLQALESSLQQRQLDTLAFYFKSKHGLFSVAMQNQGRSTLMSEIRQLENALELVSSTAASCAAEPQARMFAERLLSLSLDFVYSLLEEANQISGQERGQNRSEGRSREIDESCNILLSQIPALRKSMRTLQYRGNQTRGKPQTQVKSKNAKETDEEPNVESFIQENKLCSLQSSLISSEGDDSVHYHELVGELLDKVRGHLERKDISACQHILSNLGFDVPTTLWSLAQFYASRSLQQFITSQLSSAASLSPSQRQLVQYLDQLYRAYPCESYNTAMKSKTMGGKRVWEGRDDPLKEVMHAGSTLLLSHCGELTQDSRSSDMPEQNDDLYAALLLAWLSKWTEEMKHSVMLDAHFLSSVDAVSAFKSHPRATWKFLMSHNMLDILLSLLETAEAKSFLPSDATADLHHGWSHLRMEVAKVLMRLQKLDVEQLSSQGMNVNDILPLVGGPMMSPHPLSYTDSSYLGQCHTDFITYCVSAGLQLPLWMYCTIHGINPAEMNLSQHCSWFPFFQTVYSIPRHPTDKTLVLSASLMAAADLWTQSSGDMSVEMMLEKNQVLAAVGTLSYMSEENVNLEVLTVERYLYKFPKLMAALMPDGHESSVKQNTTVYQLLMGTAPFDLRRLFGWHSTNSFAGEDSPRVMPHFSESDLSISHTRHQKLSFPYYLKHGRPVYAFLSFLSEEFDRRESTFSHKRIQQACGAALWIACQNFNTPYISSACVVFVELLGRDSALVRAMINAGRLMLSHRHRKVSGGTESRKEQLKASVAEIVSELQACVRSRHRYGSKLIKSLEAAIKEEINIEGIDKCSYEASQKWMLAVMLCQLLGLPLSTCFLQACAESDNWLMFVWFSQLHQYPTHQLQTLLHTFRSHHLRDHLHYVLNNADSKLFSSSSSPSSISSSGRRASNDQKSSQSQRVSLYSRIGVQRSKAESSSDDEQDKNENMVISSFSSRLRQTEFNESEMPASAAPDDVFRMLFHSQSMPSQWRCLLSASVSLRNPLFAELAACCGSPPVPSLCAWILASLSPQIKQDFLSIHGQQVSKWTTEQLEALIDVTLSCGQEDTLATAFTIMQPDSLLLPFLCFVTECVKRGNYAACKTYLDQFKDTMASNDGPAATEKTQSDISMIGDRAWVEKITYQVIKHELKVVSSLYHAKHLLEILDKHNMCLVFSFDVLDFTLLHKVVSILHTHSVPNLHLASLLTSGKGSKGFVSQCEVGVDYLISCGQFAEAQNLAKVTGISRERVTMSQLKEEKQRLVRCGVWTAKFVRTQYWDKARKIMMQAECSPQLFGQFFQMELEGASADFEKAVLCQHWFTMLEENSHPQVASTRDTVFRDMWRHRIAAKVAVEEDDPLDHVFDNVSFTDIKYGDLKTDVVTVPVSSHSCSDTQEDLNAQELEVLDSLMGSYLDKGRVSSCAQVAAVFGHYNQDLAIIQTCIALACGKSTVDSIEPAMRRLVAKASARRVRATSLNISRTFSFTSTGSASSGQTDVSSISDTMEITNVMEKLYVHCVKGSQVCLRILTCFRIAEILGQDYKEVVMNSEFDSLKQLLRSVHPNKFAVARDFLATSSLSDNEVTGFLADSMVDVLKMFVKGNADYDLDTDLSDERTELIFNPSDGMEVFTQFMKLSENTALLGDHILQAVASLSSSEQQGMSTTVLTIQTELIIMAHECYTISSNLEGISHVLRAARVCCDCLADAGEFPLMIRLLTGVGRYSEMLYIFHALQQHHQFELLLRKGMDRVELLNYPSISKTQEDKLKVAILDYLKRYQPDDNEAYTMVALKFTMFRDIAGMLEACGHRSLKVLKDKPLDNTRDTQDLLKKCLQYFQDAAESYVKDNSVRKAQHCVKQARLLSLQLQHLTSGINVLHLTREQVVAFVNTHGRFIEAMVVSEAYERRTDWAEAVYNNVLVNGDMIYLQEMKLHVHITPSLVEDVIKRYKQATVKPSGAQAAIKKLLSLSKDAQLQYRLASELGLTDIVTAMLKGDTGSYLQDITVI